MVRGAHEERKPLNSAKGIDQSLDRTIHIGHVVGRGGELAARSFITFGLEQLVGNPHLDA